MPAHLIDPQALLKAAGQDPSLCYELLEIFIKSFADDIEQLDGAIQSDDSATTRHLLHRIKGSLQILGIQPVVLRIEEVSGQLHGSIEASQAAALKELFETFSQILDEAISILDHNALD